ncbi:hypothetical protein PENSOL_c178G00515, partial [Penicillium solitum]
PTPHRQPPPSRPREGVPHPFEPPSWPTSSPTAKPASQLASTLNPPKCPLTPRAKIPGATTPKVPSASPLAPMVSEPTGQQ